MRCMLCHTVHMSLPAQLVISQSARVQVQARPTCASHNQGLLLLMSYVIPRSLALLYAHMTWDHDCPNCD